jgi:hypothetical protein
MKLLQVGSNESGGPGTHRHAAYALCELAPSLDGAKNLVARAASDAIAYEIESKLAVATAHDRTVQL